MSEKNEIRAFKSEEYWTLGANFEKDGKEFKANLIKVDGKKANLKTQEDVDAIIARCSKDFIVSSIEKKYVKKKHVCLLSLLHYSRKLVQNWALVRKNDADCTEIV